MPSAFIPSRLGYPAMHLICNRYTSGQSIPVLSYLSLIHISPQEEISHLKRVRPLEEHEVDRAEVEVQ